VPEHINLCGPAAHTGIGVCVVNIAAALVRAGVKVALPRKWRQTDIAAHFPERTANALAQCEGEAFPGAPTVIVDQPAQIRDFEYQLGPSFAVPVFELDRLRPDELQALEGAQYWCAVTDWAHGVLSRAGREPIRFPCFGVDTTLFVPTPTPNTPQFRFCTVGKLEDRKGHFGLLQSFSEAFQGTDEVELWMAVTNHWVPDWMPYLKERTRELTKPEIRNKIRHIGYQASQEDLFKKVITQCQVGVFPSCAEGFCLEALEFLAAGRLVIGTADTGPADFLNTSNARIVPSIGMEVASGLHFTHNVDGMWFVPDWTALAAEMRRVYELWEESQRQVVPYNLDGIETAARFDWDARIKEILSIMEATLDSRTFE
jgi:glycosyltransferase involved in cell wall biosynthesis